MGRLSGDQHAYHIGEKLSERLRAKDTVSVKKGIKAFFIKDITDENILDDIDEFSMEFLFALGVCVDPDESTPLTEQYDILDNAFQTLSTRALSTQPCWLFQEASVC